MFSPFRRSSLRAVILAVILLLPGTPYIVSAETARDGLVRLAALAQTRVETEEAQGRIGVPPDVDELRNLSQTPPLSGANPPYPRNHVLDGLQSAVGTPPGNHNFESSPTSTGTPPANYDIETAPASVGTPPTNNDFETGDLTGWTTSGTVTIESDTPHGYYAKLSGSNAEIVSSAFTVDNSAQVFSFDAGWLTTTGYSWVKVYVLSGAGYSTQTEVLSHYCYSCGPSWEDEVLIDASAWQGQSIKLKFWRFFGDVGINDVEMVELLPGMTPTGTFSRETESNDSFVELKAPGTLTTDAFTVASDAQVGTIELSGRSGLSDQYKLQVLSGAGYSTVTDVGVGTIADSWESVQFMLAAWQGESVKLKVTTLSFTVGIDDISVQGIELPDWELAATAQIERVDDTGDHYTRLNGGAMTSEAFTLDAAAQQLTLEYRAGSASSQFKVFLLHGAGYSQSTNLDLSGIVSTTDQVNWQTFTAAVDVHAGESVKLQIEQTFGWGEYDLAGVTESVLPGWSFGNVNPVAAGEDSNGSYVTGVTTGNGNGDFVLESNQISTGIIDKTGRADQRYYAVAYDIGYQTGALIRVTWYEDGTANNWVVHTVSSSTPTGYTVDYFWLADFMGSDGYLKVEVVDDGGKLYSLADNIARVQLSEPFSEQVGYNIDTSTGNFGYQAQDLATAGVMPLQFVRYYTGHSDHYGVMGYRWTHSYDTRLVVLDNDDAGVIFGSGREIFFDWYTVFTDPPNRYIPADPRVHDGLVKNGDGTYTYTNTANLSYDFDANGVLQTISDLNGNTVTLNRDGQGRVTSVTNTAGRTLTFTYDGNGRLATATDPVGAVVSYGYDANGDLVTVTDPELNAWTYSYDRHRLLSVTAPDSTVLFSNTLDGWDRVTTQTLPDNATIQVAYDTPGAGATQVTDPESNTATYYFDGYQRTTHQVDPLGNEYEFQYDGSGNRARVVDPASNEWDFTYDAEGNLTAFDDPLGNSATVTYDPEHLPTVIWDTCGNSSTLDYDSNGNISSLTDPVNNTATFTSDASGNLLTETPPGGGTTTHTYDQFGNRTSTTNPAGDTLTMTYNLNGQMTSQTDPNGNVTMVSYNLFGRPTVIEDDLGNTLTTVFDIFGHILKQTDQLGNETLWAYDEHGNVSQKQDALGHLWNFTWDDAGNMLSETDPLGNTTSYTYDAAGHIETITNPNGESLTYGVDSAGRVTSITDELGRTVSRGFDAAGRLTSVTMPNGAVTTATYDACGNLASVTDPLGYSINYTYNALNQKISETDSNGVDTTYAYDTAGRLVSVTDDHNQTTSYTYNAAGRIATVTDPLSGVTSYGYDPAGNVTSITDPLGRVTTSTYDGLNRLSSTTDPLTNTTSYQYDAAGRQTQVMLPSGAVYSTSYDALGQVLTETDALNQTMTYTYDAARRLTTVTDPLTRVTTYGYDASGRQTSMTDALNGAVSFGYDAGGRRTSVTNPNGNTTTVAYNLLGNVTTVTDPLSRVTTYQYDLLGRQTSMTDPRNVTVGYVYDSANNLSTVNYPGGSVSYGYDTLGQRTSMTDATGTTSWAYDALGRVTSVTNPQGVVSYVYDAAGQRTSMTQPGNRTVSYGYDLAGQLTSLTDWGSQTTSFGYDVDGRRTSVTRPNGVTSSYTYDLLGQLTAIDHSSSGCLCSLQSYSYTYDAAGNRTSVTNTAGTENYVYDVLNRLTSVTYPNTDVEAYTYDANGNRLTYTFNGQTLNTYTYDNADQLTNDGVISYTHDLAGNMLTAGPDSYSWDWKNRLTGSTVGWTTASYSYDGDDVRVNQTVGGATTWYVYDRMSGLPLMIDDGTYGYVHAGGVLEQVDGQGTTDWLLGDALGSTRGVSDGAGALTGTADYAAFGAVRGQTGTGSTFGYTGEQTDASTGNVFLRARYQNPTTGRFLSADTVQPNAPGTQGYNRYSYTANNPATWTDPSGHSVGSGATHGQLDYFPSVANRFINAVLNGFMSAFIAVLQNAAPVVATANKPGGGAAPAAPTEALYVETTTRAAVGVLSVSVGALVGLLFLPSFGRIISFVLFIFAWIGAAVLFDLVGQALVLLGRWVFYTGARVATDIVDWSVDGVRTAVARLPLRPWWERCKAGAAAAAGQGIIWDTAFGALISGGSPAGGPPVLDPFSRLYDAVVGCMRGSSGSGDGPLWSSWAALPKVWRNGRQYARINGRLYSQHAVMRMMPRGLTAGMKKPTDYGRSISPKWVEYVIRNPERVSTYTRNGVLRTSYQNGSVTVVTEESGYIIVSVITK